MQPRSCQLLPRCFERHDRSPKRDTDERSQRTTQRMSNNPDIRVRIQVRDVIVKVRPDRIEQRILDEALLQTGLVASIPPRMTVAYGRPGRSDLGAAAREEEVIVQFILLDRRTAVSDEPESRGSFDGYDYGAVVRRHKYVTPEPIRVRFPTEGICLENSSYSA